MADVSSLLLQLSMDLSDPGFVRWTRDQLRAYLLEGLIVAFGKRPDLFLKRVIIKLDNCSTLQETCECDRVFRVLGQSTKDGRIIRNLRRKSSSSKIVWNGKPCRIGPEDFKLSSYSLTPTTNVLEIYPPVPAGIDVWIVVECAQAPGDLSDSDDFSNILSVAAKQWALSRAHRVDGEVNQIAFTLGRDHEAAFWRLLAYNIISGDASTENITTAPGSSGV